MSERKRKQHWWFRVVGLVMLSAVAVLLIPRGALRVKSLNLSVWLLPSQETEVLLNVDYGTAAQSAVEELEKHGWVVGWLDYVDHGSTDFSRGPWYIEVSPEGAKATRVRVKRHLWPLW